MKQYVTIRDTTYVVDGNSVYRYHPRPYAFDIDKITEPFDAFIHALAITAAITNKWDFTIFPSVEEVASDVAAREREAAACNPPGRFQGD